MIGIYGCHNPICDTFNINKMALLLVSSATHDELFDSIISHYWLY